MIMAGDEEVFSSVCYVLWDKTVAREAEVRGSFVILLEVRASVF